MRTIVLYKKVASIVEETTGGIRSGLTYAGAKNLKELREKAEFIRITNSSIVEGTPHGIRKYTPIKS